VTNTHQVDAREELSYVPSPPMSQSVVSSVPATSQHSNLRRTESRKKLPRRLFLRGNTTSSDETSPTEGIIREARRRLRRLEEESEAVDRSYRDFKIRHSESMGRTASILFHPIIHPTVFQQQRNNLGYGSFTRSQPIYSSAVGGGQNVHIPHTSRNTNYDDAPVQTQHTGTLFNPVLPHNTSTFISPSFQTAKIPPFQYTSRSQNQFAFPQRPETHGTIDNTVTNISDGITTQPQSCRIVGEFTASGKYVTSTSVPQTDSQPSRRRDVQSRGVHQRKDKTEPISSREDRMHSLSHTKLLDTYSSVSLDPHLHKKYQAKNVSFGSSLKTITIYNSPHVSSSADSGANQNNSQKELDDGTTRTVSFKSPGHTAASKKTSTIPLTRPLSSTQRLSRSDSWSEDVITKGTDKLPSCLADLSTSSTQDDDGISLQFQRSNSCRDMRGYNRKNSVTNELSDDDICKFQYKSSHRSPSLLPMSDASKSHTSVPGALYSSHESESAVSSRVSITFGSLSNNTDLQHMLSTSVSSTTVPSDKDTGSKDKSNNEKSSALSLDLGNEKISNKHKFNSSVSIIPVHEENVVSEISESGTQMIAQNKEIKTVNNSSTVVPSNEDIRENVAEDTDIDKLIDEEVFVGAESKGRSQSSLTVPGETDESRQFTTTNNQEDTKDVVEEKQTNVQEKELLKCVAERGQSLDDFPNASEESHDDKDQKFASSLKPQMADSAESVADDSDQAISVGEESKRDDSNKDDFW
jgi:hypothetical protein